MEDKNLWSDVFGAMNRIEELETHLSEAVDHRDKEIAVIYKNGVPIAQIARRVGLSRPTIHKIIDEQGARN